VFWFSDTQHQPLLAEKSNIMRKILAEIITIGDEILYGQITDTNTQHISSELDKIGIKTIRKSSVGDEESEILAILKEAEERADIILITGGLGPTKDDITKKTLCRYFNTQLKLNEVALAEVTEFFRMRNRELTEINKQQAYLPENCKMISNKMGTAPGMWFERNGKVFISMPGVPFEMKEMIRNYVLENLQKHFLTPFIYHRVIKTIGIGESFLAERISAWEDNLPENMKLAYLPSISEVKLRLTAFGDNKIELVAAATEQIRQLLPLIKTYVFGYDEDEFEKVIGDILLKHNKKVSFAESCTGGLLSYSITKIPGASAYFQGAIVAYDNDLKITQLGVLPSTLKEYGAVSEETVKEMARGARQKLNSDIGIATSGIAGPGGGTAEKPVGTIWIAYDDGKTVITRKLQLSWSREVNVRWTTLAALNMIRTTLENIEV
jgi:nicotinamide-nucleotide amidase